MERFLREFGGQTVFYLPNPGNAGDSLIAQGTYEAFSRALIDAIPIGLNDDIAGQTVFLGGGGNLVPAYHTIEAALKRFREKADRIVLLPHTIRGNERLLSELDERCTIFCRDAASYEHVTTHNTRSPVYLDHDMAFHVDARRLLSSKANEQAFLPMLKEKLAGRGLSDLPTRALVRFLRTDNEAARAQQTDMDISVEFSLGPQGVLPDLALKSAWCILKAVSTAQHVVTDRLHVGIACALAGHECTLLDNSYGKNSAVWRHSLRTRVSRLQFGVTP